MYQRPPRDPFTKRAGVRAGNFKSNPHKTIKGKNWFLLLKRKSGQRWPAMAVANFLAPCSLLILTVLLKSNDLAGSVYQDTCFTWSNCRSVTQSILEWVAGVNVHSRKGTRVPSAILDSNCNSRFVTLYILLISGDINPNSGPQRHLSQACEVQPAKNTVRLLWSMVSLEMLHEWPYLRCLG